MTDFYLGKTEKEKFFYNSKDLLTHAAIVGMTGSGKTGLCIGLMEESIINGIPSVIIDPKGDLSNLLLHFPEMSEQDFDNWSDNPDESYRLWKDGLSEWGLTPEQIYKLKNNVGYNLYTPASDEGKKVSVLSSFDAGMSWQGNEKTLREKINNLVSAILLLVGFKSIDMLQPEHILLSNIIENSWMNGESLNMFELVVKIVNPSIQNIGAFSLDVVYPFEDRQKLATKINNIVSSPNFKNWCEGDILDIGKMLYKDGKPQVNIFSINHLNESDSMFFVTMLLAAYESWMFSQSGSKELKTILYFDEVFGYLPPVKNPPSKNSLMRLLKQARAFGVGIVLATQNPIDLDYKALSNVGTWFIGKLQTERDKNRLKDGLKAAGIKDYSTIISSLDKRQFLVHNITRNPEIFTTRWTMNYLAGPLDRSQIKSLGQTNIVSRVEDIDTSQTRPFVNGYKEYFVKGDGDCVYVPTLFFRLDVSYRHRPINMTGKFESVVIGHDINNFKELEHSFDDVPVSGSYKNLPLNMDDKSIKRVKLKALEWIVRAVKPFILSNSALRVHSYVGTSVDAFYSVCRQAGEQLGEQFSISQVEKIYIDISKRSMEVKEVGVIWMPENLDRN